MGCKAVHVDAHPDRAGPQGLFVYGTLMPGHLRWPLVAAHATAWEPAEVRGSLWDTGSGWPAAVLRPGDDDGHTVEVGFVPGWRIDLRPTAARSVVRTLDAVEGVSDPPARHDRFVRVQVTPVGGAATVWAYSANVVEPTWRRIDRWAGHPER